MPRILRNLLGFVFIVVIVYLMMFGFGYVMRILDPGSGDYGYDIHGEWECDQPG